MQCPKCKSTNVTVQAVGRMLIQFLQLAFKVLGEEIVKSTLFLMPHALEGGIVSALHHIFATPGGDLKPAFFRVVFKFHAVGPIVHQPGILNAPSQIGRTFMFADPSLIAGAGCKG